MTNIPKKELNKTSKARDNEEQSQKTGTVTTDDGKKVEAVSPAIPHGQENVVDNDDNEVLDLDLLEGLIGDHDPGDKVYLPTDAEGNLLGTLVDDIGEAGEWFVPAVISTDGTGITTSSGAPIMKRMNPDTRKEQGGGGMSRAEKMGEKPSE